MTNSSLSELTLQVATGRAANIRRAAMIRRLRKQDPEHWTQTRLAEESGISQAAVQKILAKDVHPRLTETSREVLLGRLSGVVDWVDDMLFDLGRGGATAHAINVMALQANVWDEPLLDELRTRLARDVRKLTSDQRNQYAAAMEQIEALIDGPLHGPRLTEVELSRAVHAQAMQKGALMGWGESPE